MAIETIKGEITRVRRFDDGYTILSVLPDKSSDPNQRKLSKNEWGLTLVGTMPPFIEGMVIDAKVESVEHPKYGLQFKVQEITQSGFNTKDAVVQYLSSSAFKGIGSVIARKIVDCYGLDTLDILDKDPEKIREISGLGGAKADNFIEQWKQQRIAHQTMAKLIALGMSMGVAAKAFHHFGDTTISIIDNNPYKLIEIPGIGFHKADEVALKMGVGRTSINRVKAAIEYTLDNTMWSLGHCYLTMYQVIGETTKLLNNDVSNDTVVDALKAMEKDFIVTINDEKVYLTNIYIAEKEVADHIKAMLTCERCNIYNDVESLKIAIKSNTAIGDLELDPEQENAILTALNSRVCVVTGGPGTGKTTLTKVICELFDHNHIYYELCSPTGRAAKRLAEATGKEARTIHRLLGFKDGDFVHNSAEPLTTNGVLVDEVSMVDILLFRHLLAAMEYDTRLILVGDSDQLPSVGPGNVLHDLIESGVVPVVRLQKVFRQDKGSTIITVAHQILNGKVPELASPAKSGGKNCMLVASSDTDALISHVVALVSNHIPKAGYKVADIQVLTPMRERGLGVNDFNPKLQEVLNPPSPDKIEVKSEFRILRVGDRIMHIRNDYTKDVFNGDIGFIAGIDKNENAPIIYVRYPDKEDVVPYEQGDWSDIQLAYACTVHKSQGSEYPVVVLILHTSQYVMLQRNLFYTGLTRAKKLCIVAGTPEAMEVAVNNNKIQKRNTTLKERLVN